MFHARRLTASFLILMGAAALSPQDISAHADETYSWHSVTLGGGGYEPDIIFSPLTKGLAYLRTDMGGIYRWDDAQKHWIPLEDSFAQSTLFGIESVAADPKNPDKVYVAAGMYRGDQAYMLKSADRGDHWKEIQVPFHMGGNEPGRGAGERLAVDPNNTDILYFGSRWNGLQISTDNGDSWSQVDAFPHGTGFFTTADGKVDYSKPVSTGVSFVVFDPANGTVDGKTKTIFAGQADPGDHHLYRSDDAGKTWTPVEGAGAPPANFLPVHGAVDKNGNLYVVYAINSTGPYGGMTDGGVYKLDKTGKWHDITPYKSTKTPKSGYGGLALDPNHPGTLIVATAERWSAGDTLFRTTDDGKSWTDIRATSTMNVDATPFLNWGKDKPKFGWWISGVAIDPFDSAHVTYTTGATVYASDTVGKGPMVWKPMIKGMEQTAILTMMSPSQGPHLVSGMMDVGGFVHDDLSKSPAYGMMKEPVLGRTRVLDYAALAPNIMVRAGLPTEKDTPTLSYSTDYGHHWTPLPVPALKGKDKDGKIIAKRYDLTGDIAVEVSADGKTIIAMTPIPLMTHDFGQHWEVMKGLPFWARIVADRVNPNRFYALGLMEKKVYASEDGGKTFKEVGDMNPNMLYHWPTSPEAAWPLMATPGVEGDLWIKGGDGNLYHSDDGGADFRRINAGMSVADFAFGKPAVGHDYPTLFADGWNSPQRMIFRSTDMGRTWRRINDDAHQYGGMIRCLSGDPRVFGRIYVGTDGRGIVYGDPK